MAKVKDLQKGDYFRLNKRKNAKRLFVKKVDEMQPPRFSGPTELFGHYLVITDGCKQYTLEPDLEITIERTKEELKELPIDKLYERGAFAFLSDPDRLYKAKHSTIEGDNIKVQAISLYDDETISFCYKRDTPILILVGTVYTV